MSLLSAAAALIQKPVGAIKQAVSNELNGGGPITKYFAPDPSGKVRIRDVVRETPGAFASNPVFNFGREVLQGTARTGGSVGLTLFNKATGNNIASIEPPSEIDTFEKAFFSVLFGDDAVESLGTRTKKAPERATEFAKNFGLSGQSIVNPTTAPFFIAGLTALDFTGGGGKKKVVDELVNIVDPKAIKAYANANIKGLKPEVINSIADDLAAAKDSKSVQSILDDAFERQELLDSRSVNVGNSKVATTRERGFITTAKESPQISDDVKAVIESNYNPLNNRETFEQAKKILIFNPNEATRLANGVNNLKVGELRLANAISLIKISEAEKAGNIEEAANLIELIAKRSTPAGQGIQVLSALNRLSPAGILKYADSVYAKASKDLPGGIKLSDELRQEIWDMAGKIAKMPDGEDKAVETALMLAKIQQQLPTTFLKKLSTTQTLAQLLNPKTVIRNVIGNVGFAALENIKDIPAAGLDSAVSLFTGTRTKTLPSVAAQLSGSIKGFKQGVRDALMGIDTMGVPSQFDIPPTPVFKGPVGAAAEKTLNVILRGPDRALYKAAYDGSIYQSMKAHYKTTGELLDGPTDEMMEIAHYDGLYRTFQDDSAASKVFVGLKKALNVEKEFGMGDIILKYPKTPGNLLSRGLAYSPAGFINSMYQAARPLMGAKFNQKEFVESFARATTGSSALVGMGALMHRLGIITGAPEEDADINALQRTEGLGRYKINASALKRFVLSGMDPEAAKLQKGDVLYNYDWFQPAAIGISIGANIDSAAGKGELGLAGSLIEGVAAGTDTLAEQPLITGLTKFLKYGDASDAVLKSAEQIPASFIPTLLNQINTYVDNTSRNVYDPDILQQSLNAAKRKVPGLAGSLQPGVDVLGRESEIYQKGTNNLFNVFFNPAFRSVYEPTPAAELVLDLFEQTGETKQAPRIANKSVTVNGESRKLSAKELVAMQQFTGTVARAYFDQLARSDEFKQLSDEEKIKHMSNVLSDIGTAAKIVLLGEKPKKNPGERVLQIVGQYRFNPFIHNPQTSLINQ